MPNEDDTPDASERETVARAAARSDSEFRALGRGTKLGPYEVVSLIGQGGMGEVYLARDSRLRRDVAIKILPSRRAENPGGVARFEREGRAVAALSHPNILSIYDVGTEGGVTYAVMEYLQGETLRDPRLPSRA